MALDVFLLIVMLLVILAGAIVFTNAVEWFGHRLGVGEGVTGSIFAAVGTTLPETVIPLVAVFSGGESGHEVAVGSILGAPLILATLAMFMMAVAVIGLSLRGRRDSHFNVNQSIVSRDLFFFVIVYVLAIGAALIDSRSIKIVIAVILALCYVLYVWLHVKAGDDSHGEAPELGPLWFQRGAESPKLIFIALQLVFALGLIVGGAHVFVHSVETVSHALGMSTLILALFIVPLASELPEKFNSVIWVYQKKDTLAFGNISGAMVWQSSVVPIIGIVLTDWALTSESAPAFISAGVSLAAAVLIGLAMRMRGSLSALWVLAVGGVGYFGYLAYIIATQL
ncbi:MAG: sodium:calcium antiporter [Chloroflexi bacterium]|nr:sodium:calcium antiporter [Chloroflexota bacterium]